MSIKMSNYITNFNLILLTQKLQEEAEVLDWDVLVFPKTLKSAHQCMCGNKDRYITNNRYAITANNEHVN